VEGTAESTDPAPRRPAGRSRSAQVPLIFAVVGVAVALVATGLYLFRQTSAPRLTPEETVDRFLSAVFVANDTDRLDGLVCASWDAQDAMTRTARQVDSGIRVSWNEIRVVSSDARRATLRAQVGLRFQDDVRPTTYQQWHFSLVNESGWRVCEARPFRV
jgi:hypothetical protein